MEGRRAKVANGARTLGTHTVAIKLPINQGLESGSDISDDESDGEVPRSSVGLLIQIGVEGARRRLSSGGPGEASTPCRVQRPRVPAGPGERARRVDRRRVTVSQEGQEQRARRVQRRMPSCRAPDSNTPQTPRRALGHRRNVRNYYFCLFK